MADDDELKLESERTKTTDPPAATAAASAADASTTKATHPAVGIILFFVAVFAVLAALIR